MDPTPASPPARKRLRAWTLATLTALAIAGLAVLLAAPQVIGAPKIVGLITANDMSGTGTRVLAPTDGNDGTAYRIYPGQYGEGIAQYAPMWSVRMRARAVGPCNYAAVTASSGTAQTTVLVNGLTWKDSSFYLVSSNSSTIRVTAQWTAGRTGAPCVGPAEIDYVVTRQDFCADPYSPLKMFCATYGNPYIIK